MEEGRKRNDYRLSLPSFFLFPARPPFRAPFTFAPSSLSESLEQAMKVPAAACGNVLLKYREVYYYIGILSRKIKVPTTGISR